MENEVLTQILSELRELKNGQSRLEDKFSGLEDKFSGLEDKFSGFEGKFSGLEGKFSGLEEDLNIVKQSVLHLELIEVPKIHAALEGVVANTDMLYDHERRIVKLETA